MNELEQIRAQLFSMRVQIDALLDQVGALLEKVQGEAEAEIRPGPRYLGDNEPPQGA